MPKTVITEWNMLGICGVGDRKKDKIRNEIVNNTGEKDIQMHESTKNLKQRNGCSFEYLSNFPNTALLFR